MATKKKMLQAAAGQAGGAALDITDVFSTYLYTGDYGITPSTRTIQNGIDLAGEGGMVWFKGRAFGSVTNTSYHNHFIEDTERGAGNLLSPNLTDAAGTLTNGVLGFNSDGFDAGFRANIGTGDFDYASWTFRKAPKFFDVVTYTGTGSDQTISHNLGTDVGMIVVKRTNSSGDWYVWHRGHGNGWARLNLSDAFTNDAQFVFAQGGTYKAPNSTEFYVTGDNSVGGNGSTYVAYLFAHNNGDGEFGPDGDQDIIKCGSYVGNGSTNGPEIDLGFEPQWVLVKKATAVQGVSQDWFLFDSMRGWLSGSSSVYGNLALRPNSSGAEWDRNDSPYITSTGFQLNDAADRTNGNGDTYIYMAIRRGPLAQPESGTEVFAIDTAAGTPPTPPTFVSGFPVDFSFYKNKTDSVNNWGSQNRLTGYGDLAFNTTSAEVSNNGSYWQKDYMNGIGSQTVTNSNGYQWMFKRSPGFFDVVAYSGNSTAGHTVSHNLGVVPEMMWVKSRSKDEDWPVYHEGLGSPPEENYIYLNHDRVKNFDGNTIRLWNHTSPTDSEFTLGIESRVNLTGHTYIAYLFATLPGVSKVGSFSHTTGSATNVDCGFTAGARFVLIKRTDNIGHWLVFDTERGITAGNDSWLNLNLTSAEDLSYDFIDPLSSGFTVDGSGLLSTGSYIFYAIA